jgi:hypothetical protein
MKNNFFCLKLINFKFQLNMLKKEFNDEGNGPNFENLKNRKKENRA